MTDNERLFILAAMVLVAYAAMLEIVSGGYVFAHLFASR